MRFCVLFLVSFCLPAQVIQSVGNAASLAGSGLAQGSVIQIGGAGLGPATAVVADLPYPTQLSTTTVALRPVNGDPVQLFIRYASATTILAIVPSTLPIGDADLTVTVGSSTSRAARVPIVAQNVGLFSRSGDGTGPASARVGDQQVLLAAPIKPGQLVAIAATGFGPIDTPDNEAPNGKAIDADVEVRLG